MSLRSTVGAANHDKATFDPLPAPSGSTQTHDLGRLVTADPSWRDRISDVGGIGADKAHLGWSRVGVMPRGEVGVGALCCPSAHPAIEMPASRHASQRTGNDIGSSVCHYFDAYIRPPNDLSGKPIGAPRADWLTVNAYLGREALNPYEGPDAESSGLFVLVRTSNPGAADIQDRDADGHPVFAHVAELVRDFGSPFVGESGWSSIGAVVGATWPQQARSLRRLMPSTLFLVPPATEPRERRPRTPLLARGREPEW